MSSFFGGGSTSRQAQPIKNETQRKEAVMAQVRAEVQAANAKELLESLTDKCYMKCVTKPSTSLSSSEETCVSRCMELYFQAFNIVAKTYATRLQKERLAMKDSDPTSSF
ncbi:hypothetical protein CPB86DRAFT_711503 [Serendipita vermifera]|nr:hypothetical protein CPB86DRAFT_711503 [Serendipita vermifera]